MSLRILAVAAPQFQDGAVGSRALGSADPASLFNACREAASLASRGIGAWGTSNWSVSRKARRESVVLLESFQDGLEVLDQKLDEIRPNLVLIGAMSVCFPGAIACAKYVKEQLGDDVCVVLGGRHANETVFQASPSAPVAHHRSSPLALMRSGELPPVFDIVVSGDGEHIIAAIGELVARCDEEDQPAAMAKSLLCECTNVPGRWIAGSCIDGEIRTVAASGGPLNHDRLEPPSGLFGVRTRFDCFGGRPTAHVFSDIGRGCIYDCQFCSERRSATGLPAQMDTSADRLFRQLESSARVIEEDYPGVGASAFVEDSTLLSGQPAQIRRLVELLKAARLDIRFGAQLTIDQILARPELLAELREVGLEYLFIGLETLSPADVGGMSKDVGRNRNSWARRAEDAFEILTSLQIKCGAALLFGLGERHENRLALIRQIEIWRARYGFPNPISMNWAVQHPLLGNDGGTNYTYTDWAIPRGPFLEAFRDFGEASVRYPLAGQAAPVLEEVREVHAAIAALSDGPCQYVVPSTATMRIQEHGYAG